MGVGVGSITGPMTHARPTRALCYFLAKLSERFASGCGARHRAGLRSIAYP
jgi:hypothetical protein